MDEFTEVRELLRRNNTYREEHKRAVEQELLNREPLGDWQSPSDNERWRALHERLEFARLSYNISRSVAKPEEQGLLERSAPAVREAIESNMDMLREIDAIKNTSWFMSQQRFEEQKARRKIPFSSQNRVLEGLLHSIETQLLVYRG
jgi:hypothetical protein